MNKKNILDNLYNEVDDIVSSLELSQEVTLAIDAKRYFTKIYILSAASYFENEIQRILEKYILEKSNNNQYLYQFVLNKAISMQYHTYFDWGKRGEPTKPNKSGNKFFSLFGSDFKDRINDEISKNEEIKESMQSFIEIGHMRNILVHNNFAAYNNIPKTIEEFKELYEKGSQFLKFIENYLMKNG